MTGTGGEQRIAVDAMGGDWAPREIVEGAVRAVRESGCAVILVGHRNVVAQELERLDVAEGEVEVEHASEVVAMEERAIAVRQKRDASVRVCARLVREGRARAFFTAGNTGAAMVAAKMVMGTVPGVDRPALAAVFPNQRGRTVVLDVGANLEARTSHLREFAVMGHFFAQEIVGTPAPRIGLMSVGEEDGKGTDQHRERFRVLKESGLNFVGNVEGGDVFQGTVDVIVCDGFVGNVLLKASEALADYLGSLVRQELSHSMRSKMAFALAEPAFQRMRERTDWSEHGAAPLLGVEGGCFIGHGRSTAKAVHSAIRRAEEFCRAELHDAIREKVAELHTREESLSSDRGDTTT